MFCKLYSSFQLFYSYLLLLLITNVTVQNRALSLKNMKKWENENIFGNVSRILALCPVRCVNSRSNFSKQGGFCCDRNLGRNPHCSKRARIGNSERKTKQKYFIFIFQQTRTIQTFAQFKVKPERKVNPHWSKEKSVHYVGKRKTWVAGNSARLGANASGHLDPNKYLEHQLPAISSVQRSVSEGTPKELSRVSFRAS